MKNPAAVALGRLGGQVKSDRKAAAARANGQKGGWPKGKRRKVRVFLGTAIADELKHFEKRVEKAISDSLRTAARASSGRPKGKQR